MAQEGVGAVDCRSHCCTDQAPGREVVVDCRTRCCTDHVPDPEVAAAAGCTPDFRIRRRGQRHSLTALKCPRQAKRSFQLK
jgi:hypothetical protein